MSISDSALQIIGCGVLSVLCAYGAGRIHQWYEHSMDRDRPFRDGYNDGYSALFPLAARGRWLATDPTTRPEPDGPDR
jgi:hypothetical protein